MGRLLGRGVGYGVGRLVGNRDGLGVGTMVESTRYAMSNVPTFRLADVNSDMPKFRIMSVSPAMLLLMAWVM